MNECASTSLLAWYDYNKTSVGNLAHTAFQVSKPGRKVYVTDDIGADSTLERESTDSIHRGCIPRGYTWLRARALSPHTREGVLVLNFARWGCLAGRVLNVASGYRATGHAGLFVPARETPSHAGSLSCPISLLLNRLTPTHRASHLRLFTLLIVDKDLWPAVL